MAKDATELGAPGPTYSDTVLLLGAGASADCGIPTAEGFAEPIRRHLERIPNPDSGLLLHAFAQVIRATKCDRPDIETLYQLIDDVREGHPIRPELDGGDLKPSRELERLQYEIKKCIQAHCALDDRAGIAHMDRLAAFVRREGSVAIASLNYDNVIELMAGRNGLSVLDPVIPRPSRSGHHDILLLKLHGSITWHLNDAGRVTEFAPFSLRAIRALGAMRTATLEAPLIYPSRRKLPLQLPYMQNGARFQMLLRSAKHVIAIGYRFADAHVRLWVVDALRRNPELELTIVGRGCADAVAIMSEACMADTVMRRVHALEIATLRELLETDGLEAVTIRRKSAGRFRRMRTLTAGVPARPGSDGQKPLLGRRRRLKLAEPGQNIHGLAASHDGRHVYAIVGNDVRSVIALELATGAVRTLLRDAGEGRELDVGPLTGTIYFVDNRLFRPLFMPTSGLGRVRCLDPQSGKTWTITRPGLRNLLAVLRKVRETGWRADLRSKLNNVLSWPTDLIVSPDEQEVLVTQAPELSRIDVASGAVSRVARPPLCFNLHALAKVDPDLILGVEQGIAQADSWSRLIAFTRTASGSWESKAVTEGDPRLHGIAIDTRRREALVAQCLAWPHGRILVFAIPDYRLVRIIGYLDFPGRLVTHADWRFAIVSCRTGLVRIDLDQQPRTRGPCHLP